MWSTVEIDWTRQERGELASFHLPVQPKPRGCHKPHGVGRAQEYQKMTNWGCLLYTSDAADECVNV